MSILYFIALIIEIITALLLITLSVMSFIKSLQQNKYYLLITKNVFIAITLTVICNGIWMYMSGGRIWQWNIPGILIFISWLIMAFYTHLQLSEKPFKYPGIFPAVSAAAFICSLLISLYN